MIIRSRAPLRLGLCGGGTDIPEFYQRSFGCVINATIQKYVYSVIKPNNGGAVFRAIDLSLEESVEQKYEYRQLPLHYGAYVYACTNWNQGKKLNVQIETYSESPARSGLGASSALVVSQLAAYAKLLNITLTKEELAEAAYVVERKILKFSGGKQDQWASVFGGLNYFEFNPNESVKRQPLLLEVNKLKNLESSLSIFYVGFGRGDICSAAENIEPLTDGSVEYWNSLFGIKEATLNARAAIADGKINEFLVQLGHSWRLKMECQDKSKNSRVLEVHESALEGGAMGSKICGAGMGGYMVFLLGSNNDKVFTRAMEKFAGERESIKFDNLGAIAWRSEQKDLWKIEEAIL